MKTLDYLHLEAGAAGKVVVSLQQLLADFQVHYMNLRGFHWNIKGRGFFVLHAKFEELYDDAAEKVDQIAERILQLGGVPSNKFSEYLKVAKIAGVDHVSCGGEALEHILDTYGYLIGEERKALSVASQAGDEVTVSTLTDYLAEQEKWSGCSPHTLPASLPAPGNSFRIDEINNGTGNSDFPSRCFWKASAVRSGSNGGGYFQVFIIRIRRFCGRAS